MVSLREMARADAERIPPAWLVPLLEATFFEECPDHVDASRAMRGGGCNYFCTDCTGRPLCQACIADDDQLHAGHHVIQIRKSSKHTVVKAKDVDAVLNVGEVQPYLINGQRVMFLNPRPQTGKGKAGECRCDNCSRALLRKAYRFCSLRCKLDCMDWDLDVSFAVDQPAAETESESMEEEEDAEIDDDDAASSLSTTRLRNTGSVSTKGGNDDGGAGTSTAPATSSPGH